MFVCVCACACLPYEASAIQEIPDCDGRISSNSVEDSVDQLSHFLQCMTMSANYTVFSPVKWGFPYSLQIQGGCVPIVEYVYIIHYKYSNLQQIQPTCSMDQCPSIES